MNKKRRHGIMSIVTALIVLWAGSASAQLAVWTGGGTTDAWSDAGNWLDGNVPDVGWSVVFDAGTPSRMDIPGLGLFSLNADLPGSGITLEYDLGVDTDAVVDELVLGGNTLSVGAHLSAAGPLVMGTGAVVVGGDFTFADLVSGTGSISLGGSLTGGGGAGHLLGPLQISVAGGVNFGDALVEMAGGSLAMYGIPLTSTSPVIAELGDLTTYGPTIVSGLFSFANINILGGGVFVVSNASFSADVVTVAAGGSIDASVSEPRTYAMNRLVLDSAEADFNFLDAGSSLLFTTGVEVNGTGIFGVFGMPGHEAVIDLPAPGPQWVFSHDPGATVLIQWVEIRNGAAIPPVGVYDCIDGGNNTGFWFGPDKELRVTSLLAPTEVREAMAEITATFTVANEGWDDSGPFRASLRISPDSLITDTDIVVATVDIENIAQFSAATSTVQGTLPWDAPRGDVYLGVLADDLNQVPEGNEANNSRPEPFRYQVPLVQAVRDVPGDQGGQIYLSWFASPLDPPAGGGTITQYLVWRAIAPEAAAAAIAKGEVTVMQEGEPLPSGTDRVLRVEQTAGRTFFWHPVDTTGAFHRETYGYPEPTMFDSTGQAWEYTYFQVSAHTVDELVFYLSNPDSGYSVDNLAPAEPVGFAAAARYEPSRLVLQWQANAEADIGSYLLYRSADPQFVPGPENLLATVADTMFTDAAWQLGAGYRYTLAAVDIHGNNSGFVALEDADVSAVGDGPPRVTQLHGNRPNPFNPTTVIVFELAREEPVHLTVYDAAGRLVATLVDESRPRGRHEVAWDGRDRDGRMSAAGVYLYRLRAGEFVATRRMALVK